MRHSLFHFLFLAILLSTSHAKFDAGNPIRLLRRGSSTAVRSDSYKINCLSFRVGVEANNLRDWGTVPSYCKSYIKTYLEKKQYGLDVEAVVVTALEFADDMNRSPKDVWVFDVEETLLSNLNYLASSDVEYGTKPIDPTSYYEWLQNTTYVPPVPSIQDLFNALLTNDYEIVLISEAPESLRESLTDALQGAGFTGWSKLVLKGDADNEKSVVQYKSEKRKELVVDQSYRIVGNVGDQWSDLTGENAGVRTFKVPNPVYYVA